MPLARDASSPAVKLSGFIGTQTTSQASNSFTPPAGSVIVVTCLAGDSFQNDWDVAKPTITNSGTALTWHQISSQFNNGLTNKSIRTTAWWAFTATAPGSMTATVAEGTQAGQTITFTAIIVDVWTGALTGAPIGATAVSNATTGGTRTVAITPTALGSALVMAAGNWNDATAVAATAGTGCFLLDDPNQGTNGIAGGQIWLGSGSSTPTLTTSLVSVNLIMANTATFAWSVVAYEVLPALAASTPQTLYAPGWHPGLGLPGVPGGTPFYAPKFGSASGAVTQFGDGTAIAGAAAVAAVVTEIPFAASPAAAAVTASVVQIATASLAGAAAVTALVTQIAPASPAGAGTVTDVATQAVTATAAGAGAVTDVATQIAIAAPAGAGQVTAKAVQAVTASPAGAGSVTDVATQAVTAAPAGAASVTDVVTQIVIASLAGAGVVNANAAGAGSTANITAAGALSANAVQITGATPAAAAALTAAATQQATAALTAAGTVTATAIAQGPFTVGTLTASQSASALTAAAAASALTTGTVPTAALTATTARTGGPGG